MDKKAEIILQHYKDIIENCLFDEYDLLGFLIFIRSYIEDEKTLYRGIYECCDIVAHRKERDNGMVADCIKVAIDNNYETLPRSKVVKGYKGISKENWQKEWKRLGQRFDINISKQALFEIILCLFSLLQFTIYKTDRGSGTLEILQGNNELSLSSTEGKDNSPRISFSVFGPYNIKYTYYAGLITDPVETRRVKTELQLWAGENRII